MFIWEDGSLEILNVTRADEGSYTCFAENDRGKANSTGSLTVLGEFNPIKGRFCNVSMTFAVADWCQLHLPDITVCLCASKQS